MTGYNHNLFLPLPQCGRSYVLSHIEFCEETQGFFISYDTFSLSFGFLYDDFVLSGCLFFLLFCNRKILVFMFFSMC